MFVRLFFKMQNIIGLFSEETQKMISNYMKSCLNLPIIRGIQDFLKLLNNTLHPFNGQELGSWVISHVGGFVVQRETGMSVLLVQLSRK